MKIRPIFKTIDIFSFIQFLSRQTNYIIKFFLLKVLYLVPYAHYLYEGRVMGPNVPLHEGGQLVGFFSPKAPKKYTGKKLQFHGAPKRGARWFDRMKRVHTADIVAEANRAYRGGRVL